MKNTRQDFLPNPETPIIIVNRDPDDENSRCVTGISFERAGEFIAPPVDNTVYPQAREFWQRQDAHASENNGTSSDFGKNNALDDLTPLDARFYRNDNNYETDEIDRLKDRVVHLSERLEQIRRMFTDYLMPCGHPSAFTVEDEPDKWYCLYCEFEKLESLTAENAALRERLDALAWARWIPASEELPDNNAKIIILRPVADGEIRNIVYRSGSPWKFTHWMPLPPVPQETENA